MPKESMNKVTVLLNDEEFDRLDAYCRDRGFKKSTLISRLIRQYLDMEAYHPQRQPAPPAGRPSRG